MKEKSYMMAIPPSMEEIKDQMEVLRRLNNAPDFKVESTESTDGSLFLNLVYRDEKYRAEVYPATFEIPELYRCQHLFPDLDVKLIQEVNDGLAVVMRFGEDALSSYHLQLKLIHAMLPDVIAVLDDSSEKILSGHWVALAAVSNVSPAPRYLFTSQAVSGEEDVVWLHTHGLNRCGLTELEVLNSSKETYTNHYNILETLAKRLLEMEEPLEPHEPLYLARLTAEIPLIVTIVPWQEAVEHYDDDMLGGSDDREESHNQNTSAIFTYQSQEDYENEVYSPISVYDEIVDGNPIYWFSNAETERMKALAAERISYLYQASKNQDNKVLVKIGLTVDEELQEENSTKEHIWFELLEVGDNTMKLKLTQEPYYVKAVHEGDIMDFTVDDVTDWIIYTPDRAISPDDVYILDL